MLGVMKWLVLDEKVIRNISHRDGTIVVFASHCDIHHLSERDKEVRCVSALAHKRCPIG
jgi:hypothetical protein